MSNDRNVNDNPEAFPWNGLCSPGMTLRDYFAAKALQGGCSSVDVECVNKPVFAKWCYEMADAMLKARKCDD